MRSPKSHSIPFLLILIAVITAELVWWPASQKAARRTTSKAEVVEANVAPVAATFTVNTSTDLSDSSVGDGHCDTDGNLGDGDQCTLRAAIQEANALASADVISFNLPANSVITLNSSLDFIAGDLDIIGPGANSLTIQRSTAGGTPRFRIFTILHPSTVNISGLTMANGHVLDGVNGGDGGGVWIDLGATLNLTSVAVQGNLTGNGSPGSGGVGGGVFNFGTATITNSTISGNATGTGGSDAGAFGGYGGGIYNAGALTLTNTTVSNNTTGNSANPFRSGYGGGIYNNGTLTVTNTTISANVTSAGDGGGIYSIGTLTLNSSAVYGNTAGGSGGGVFNFSSFGPHSATLNNSTISGNSAGANGGGIYNYANCPCSGSSTATATIIINNGTISGNSSGFGGGIANASEGSHSLGILTIDSGTVARNNVNTNSAGNFGGGIANHQFGATNPITLRNTIVAGNLRNSVSTDDILGPLDPSSSFDLIGDGTGMSGVTNGSNGSQIGTSGAPINPLLGPLADNGGPTLTHALLVGSPAIDAGNTSQTTDQRGQSRPIDDPNVANAAGGNASDIGAYESNIFQVNTIADADDGACTDLGTGNGCTLREAINAANTNLGEVSFAPALTSGGPAVITLATALPALSSRVTIQGPGSALLTIQRSSAGGTPDFSIFAVNSGAVGTISKVSIGNGKVSNPNPGGGILNSGTLTLSDSTVSGNSPVGILNTANLTINNSLITGNTGKGISSSVIDGSSISLTVNNSVVSANAGTGISSNASPGNATLTINGSTISGNTGAFLGGGVSNGAGSLTATAVLTINNSTISGNSSTNGGGGVYNAAVFGTASATATINNTTISGNSDNSGGGGIYDVTSGSGVTSNLTLTNCTITNNNVNGGSGGGIGISIFQSPAVVKLRNSIVAGNLKSSATPDDISGSVDSTSSSNLIGTGGSGGLSNGTNNNQVGVSNPGLGPLANNGGTTQTHALLLGSPAIDAGDNCVVNNSCSPALASALTSDQRGSGFNRSADGNGDGTARVDIGAYEVQSILVTNLNDSGVGSLRQAIIDANASPDTNIINFQTGLTGTISLLTALPDLSTSMSINGPGANVLTIQRSGAGGTPSFRVFSVVSGNTVRFSRLTIANGRTPDNGFSNGGGILNDGTVTLNSVSVTGNMTGTGGFALNGGGGIYNSGSLNIINSTINGNITGNGSGGNSGGYGGGIYNASGATMSLTNSTVSGNTTGNATTGAGGEGGGIYNVGSLTLTNTTVSQNHTGTGFTGGSGGGINGSATLGNSIVANNTVPPGANGPDFYGSCDSQDYNLIANTSNMIFLHTKPHDITDVNALLGPLAGNGGSMLTHALLPGSPAINAGSNATLPADTFDLNGNGNTTEPLPVDQRGFARVALGTVDIGAFESRGFTITATGGTPQSAPITSTFASPLSATVSSAFGEPVSGGAVIFTPPATGPRGSFASSESLGVMVLLNGSGVATTPAFTANGIGGSYSVAASGSGISGTANFSLTNLKASTSTSVSSSVNPSEVAQSVTLTATVSNAIGITPTGTVQFMDGVNNLGSPTTCFAGPGSTCTAQISFSSLVAGNHAISASYSGDGNFNGSSGVLPGGQTVKPPPSLSINDVSMTEGDSGTKTLTFTVTLSASSNLSVTANYATADNTATAPGDYVAQSGTLTFNPGDTTKTIGITVNGDQAFESNETFFVNLTTPINATISDSQGQGTILNDDAQGGIISFSASEYTVFEADGSVTITVNRTGDTTTAATVDYATDDTGSPGRCADFNGLASSKCDFTTALGRLQFGVNETQKTFSVLVNRDSYTSEIPSDAFTVKLSNLTGGAVFGTNSTATVKIMESGSPGANAIDDSSIFVRQHYHDFLNREPDASGLQFWTNEIESCGTDAACREVKRINVSGAFFLSIEFQQTGYLIERLYKTAYGDATGNSTFPSAHTLPVPMVRFSEFLADTQEIGRGVVVGPPGWEQQIENNKVAFVNLFVQRQRFTNALGATSNPQFVDTLNANAGNPLSQGERDQLVADLNTSAKTRAQVLRAIAEHPSLVANEFNRAFVLMQFFGYLRRNPDDPQDHDHTGYDFWLTKLNQFGGNFQNAEMVKAFISSDEYRHRFGP